MLTIRLRRQGARNNPFYRVVLSDSRRTPRATALEELGYYDPTRSPKVLSLKEERIDYWVSQGAQVSETLTKLRKKDFSLGSSGAGSEAAVETEAKTAEPAAAEAVEETASEEAAETEAAATDTADKNSSGNKETADDSASSEEE